MPYTLGEAAKATGKSKPTIQRSIKLGRISATKNVFGNWQIEPAELHRVYPPIVTAEHHERGVAQHDVAPSNGAVLQAENQFLRERLAEKDRIIEDLRQDREHWRQQATALLPDRRPWLERVASWFKKREATP